MEILESLLSIDVPTKFFNSELDKELTRDVLENNALENPASVPNSPSPETNVKMRSHLKLMSVITHFEATRKCYFSSSFEWCRKIKATRKFHLDYINELYVKYPLFSQIPNLHSLINYKDRMFAMGRDMDFENQSIEEHLSQCFNLYHQLRESVWSGCAMPIHINPWTVGADLIAISLEKTSRFIDEAISRNKNRMAVWNDCKTQMLAYLDRPILCYE